MIKGLLGRKIGMTSYFDENGTQTPCTVVEAGPCTVLQIKTRDNDGYEAVQLGFVEKREKRTNKPLRGHFRKSKVKPKQYLGEVRLEDASDLKPGQTVDVKMFNVGDVISVTGVTKGKGFQGTVKRHGFAGGTRTHGQSDRLRAPGSIGQSSYPSRVFKGIRMAGRTGGEKLTVRNLTVVKIIPESNLLLIKGAVPGSTNGLVMVLKQD